MAFTREDVEKLSASLGEPGWVLDRRLEAWGFFEKFEIPHEKEEAWRYTDFRRLKFKLDAFAPASPGSATVMTQSQSDLLKEEGDRAGYVVQRDSDIVFTELNPDVQSRGVILIDLDSAIRQHPDLVSKHLFTRFRPDAHIFTALHGALFTGGTFLYVPKGVTVTLPIETQRWMDQSGSAVFPHTLIVVEEGAEVVYFERFESAKIKDAALSIAALEVIAGQASRVSAVALQEFQDQIWHFQTQHAALGRDVSYKSLVVGLGARFARTEVATLMAGQGSNVDMLGLYFADRGQHFDFRTLQDHAGTHCTSDLLYKGALKDESHTVYSGLIHVRPEGAETDAYQTNRNLVLSDHAKADSKPELEIENNDVRCSHGASVGQMNEDEVYYLLTRGIRRKDAERLIVEGFFEDVIARISDREIRGVLGAAIDRKLSGV